MGSPRCWAEVGEAVTVSVADGENRTTLLGPVLGVVSVICSPLKSALSLKTKVVRLVVGLGSVACTVRCAVMISVALGASEPFQPGAWLVVMLVMAPLGGCTTPLTTRLPISVSVTFCRKRVRAPVFCTDSV